MRILREVGITVLVAIAIFVLLRINIQGYTVQYSSMLPTFAEGEWVMVNKAKYFFSDPERGDVIVFSPPMASDHPFIKRVIGLPGDSMEVRDGEVLVNGTPLQEDYIMAAPNYNMAAEDIPEGQYFVLGDNRNSSNDSHNGWTVGRESIVGIAWFVYWPPAKWHIVQHFAYPELSVAAG